MNCRVLEIQELASLAHLLLIPFIKQPVKEAFMGIPPTGTHPSQHPYHTRDDKGKKVKIEAFTIDKPNEFVVPEGYHRVTVAGTDEVVVMDSQNYHNYCDTIIRAETENLDSMAKQLRGITKKGLPSLIGAGGVFEPRAPGRLTSIPVAYAVQFTAPLDGIAKDSAYHDSETGEAFFVRGVNAGEQDVTMEGISLSQKITDPGTRENAVKILQHNGLIPHRLEEGGPIIWATPQAWQNYLARGGGIEADTIPKDELAVKPPDVISLE